MKICLAIFLTLLISPGICAAPVDSSGAAGTIHELLTAYQYHLGNNDPEAAYYSYRRYCELSDSLFHINNALELSSLKD